MLLLLGEFGFLFAGTSPLCVLLSDEVDKVDNGVFGEVDKDADAIVGYLSLFTSWSCEDVGEFCVGSAELVSCSSDARL